MEQDRESFKKMFPNLVKELQTDDNKVQLNSVRTNQEDGEKAATSQSFDDYMPDVIDFIRRCDTKEQAEEIIVTWRKRAKSTKKMPRSSGSSSKRRALEASEQRKSKITTSSTADDNWIVRVRSTISLSP